MLKHETVTDTEPTDHMWTVIILISSEP